MLRPYNSTESYVETERARGFGSTSISGKYFPKQAELGKFQTYSWGSEIFNLIREHVYNLSRC